MFLYIGYNNHEYMKKLFSIKINSYLISITVVITIAMAYFLVGDRSYYLIRYSIIAFLVTAIILEYMSYKTRNLIDYYRNPLTIVMGITDTLKIEEFPSKEKEQIILLKKTLDNMEKMYNELT